MNENIILMQQKFTRSQINVNSEINQIIRCAKTCIPVETYS